MKKYKNVLWPLGSYVVAFVWYFIFMSSSSSFSQFVPYKSGDVMNTVVIGIYFLFIIIGLFFGLRSKKKESTLLNNLITLIGIFLLIGSLVLYSFYSGFSG